LEHNPNVGPISDKSPEDDCAEDLDIVLPPTLAQLSKDGHSDGKPHNFS